ncbi:MAG: hypothetical protein C0472_06605 [Erythrobacter sp.]|nr:hypothetical protein [Erythrobacter sp.]MBA4051552.1 hypothetical protein [Erythrobacter sp.]MBA4174477.1 hypothetical protein [Hyphomicrobium sp.]
MSFVVRLFLIVLAIAAGSSAARAAQPDAPDVAGEMCGAFHSPMGDEDLVWLKFQLVNRAPARYAPVLKNVALVLVDDTTNLGPVYVAGSRARIEVGPAFLEDLCLSTLLQDYAMRLPASEFLGLRAALRACIRTPQSALPCFRQSVRELSRAKPPAWSTAAEKTEFIRVLRYATLSTASFLLAHEAAHAVFRAPGAKSVGERSDEEYDADIFAYLASLTDGTLPLGPLFTFATQSLVDDLTPGERAPTHGSSICRLARSGAILQRLFVPAMQVQALAGRFNPPAADEAAKVQEALSQEKFVLPTLVHGRGAQTCKADFDRQLEELESDLDAIRGLYATTMMFGSEAGGAELVSKLSRYEYKTAGGMRLGKTMAVGLVAKQSGVFELYAKIVARQIGPDDVVGQYTDFSARIRDAVGADPLEYLPAGEAFDLEVASAMAGFVGNPRGTQVVEVNRNLLAQLDAAFGLSDPIEELRALRYLRNVIPGTEDQFTLGATPVFLYQVARASATIIATGECDAAMKMIVDAGSIIFGSAMNLNAMAQTDCKTTRDGFAREQVSTFGWTYEPAAPQ